ncbi:MAG: MBL fold metallo-hydrolase [Sedimenticola sp.]|nr:MBL fold metallo-hydrolase [Sedimenticola sp.]
MQKSLLLFVGLLLTLSNALAFETVQINPRVYALVGELGQRSPENLGHNMTSGFIIGDEGIAVIDSGACLAGAERIHAAIRKVSDKPVRWVINTGGQDHRWLGNDYFRQQGAIIIASVAAATDMRERADKQMAQAQQRIGKGFTGTTPAYPDQTFEQRLALPLKGIEAEVIFSGGGHTPGDSIVWLPKEKIAFTGDLVYVQRLLGVREIGAAAWISSLEYLRDTLQPRTVIPGHGHVTDLNEALSDSYNYLIHLREAVQQKIDDGAFDPVEASQGLDQSRFSYLENYADLRFRSINALNVAEELFRNQ